MTPITARISPCSFPDLEFDTALSPARMKTSSAIAQTMGTREKGPGSRALPNTGVSSGTHDRQSERLRGGRDPCQAPSTMRHEPSTVGHLVVLVVRAGVDRTGRARTSSPG